jgi:hypothetical protein
VLEQQLLDVGRAVIVSKAALLREAVLQVRNTRQGLSAGVRKYGVSQSCADDTAASCSGRLIGLPHAFPVSADDGSCAQPADWRRRGNQW